jgi:hypothetical protein
MLERHGRAAGDGRAGLRKRKKGGQAGNGTHRKEYCVRYGMGGYGLQLLSLEQ